MKRNYQTELDAILINLDTYTKPSLLLHSCCGPCSTYVLSYLAQYFNITLYFYNPNIMPLQEYITRLETQQQVLTKLTLPNKVSFVEGPRDFDQFLKEIKGYEMEPEHGKRCNICIEMRIKKTAQYAKEHSFDYYCTTLSVSPHKDAVLINSLTEHYSAEYGTKHIPSDFKKKNGYLTSTKLSKELGLYRQNYCGCIFSKDNNTSDD